MEKTAQKNKATKDKGIIFKRWLIPALTVLIVAAFATLSLTRKKEEPTISHTEPAVAILSADNLALPKPELRSSNSLEAVLKNRRSRREFIDKEITLKQVSQMLWAAQGVTVDWGGRTSPSAKSTYPLSVFLVANKVAGLDAGEYQYIAGDRTPVHELKPIKKVDLQKALYEGLNDSAFHNAPAVLIITGNMSKMAEAFGGIPHDKEVYLEAGHAAQNLYLQAESLRLGMVTISTFSNAIVKDLVTIPPGDTIIYLIPFGTPKL